VNILLTGGTGYIGSHTAVVLIEAGHKVVLFDNLSNSRRDVVNRLESITNQSLTFVEGDIRDSSLLSKAIKDFQVEAVIHFAGLKAVAESLLDPLRYYDNNVVGTIKLLEAMQKNNVTKIVFSSSATVYGDPKYLPYDEEHATSPINPYGRTKLYIENLLYDLANSNPDWSVGCLRYFNPVGAHESGLIGENPKGIPCNLMPYILEVAAGKYPYIKVFGNDYPTHDGTGVRDYIHVTDLADGHNLALKVLSQKKGWNVFNLGTGKGYSVLDLINCFENVNKIKLPYKFEKRRDGDLAEYYASATKAEDFLGWKANKTLGDICKSSWNWVVKERDNFTC